MSNCDDLDLTLRLLNRRLDLVEQTETKNCPDLVRQNQELWRQFNQLISEIRLLEAALNS